MKAGIRVLLALAVGLTWMGASRPAHASFINYSSKEINIKIVYYGAGSAGRRNLEYIYRKTNPAAKGKMIKLATDGADVMFFDFLPLSLGEIRGFKTRFHLYTVPNGREYSASRQLVLKGVDGVVFMASAAKSELAATRADWKALKRDLSKLGYDREAMPVIIQLDAAKVKGPKVGEKELRKALGIKAQRIILAETGKGSGVFDTIKGMAKLCLMALRDGAKGK